ncbi:MAG: VOC family protein [Selenomonadaceae bacterium]|nr:VOC family protein [Selenomonadaceae bacterium]
MLKYAFTHANLTVTDLSRSLKFYDEALNLKEVSRREFDDCFMIYLRGEDQNFELELRVNKNPVKKINLGDNPTHLAFVAEDFNLSLEKHRAMNCVSFAPEDLEIYFITDPDGYKLEIVSKNFSRSN